MRISEFVKSEMNYSRKLLEVGLDAVHEANAARSREPLRQASARSARSGWLPAIFGSGVGLLAIRFAAKSKSMRGAIFGTLVGGALGFSGTVVWTSRDVTLPVIRKAAKNLTTVRDKHWLEKHPISYA